MLFRTGPPLPNQVIIKMIEATIIKKATTWRQKPPGSSCSGAGSLEARLREDLREDFRLPYSYYITIKAPSYFSHEVLVLFSRCHTKDFRHTMTLVKLEEAISGKSASVLAIATVLDL